MVKLLLSLLLSVVSLLPARVGIAQVSTTDDSRLAMRYSLSEPGIRLGALLERLSEKSGVSLSIDSNNEWSGVRLFVELRDLPLENTLRSLQSFFSHEGVSSQWVREGDTTFRYRLVISPRYNRPKRDRRYWADRNYRLLEDIGRYAALSSEERARLNGPGKENKPLYYSLQDSHVLDAVRLMQSLFEPKVIQQILGGEYAPRVTIKNLQGEDRVRAERIFRHNQRFFEESARADPEQGSLVFQTSASGNSDITTSLDILSPLKDGSPVGSNYVGRFMEEQARKEMGDFWKVRGDMSATEPLSAQDPAPVLRLLQADTVKASSLFHQLSDTLGVSVIALLPGDDQIRISLDRSKPLTTLSGILEKMSGFDPAVLLKRHAGVLLACPAPWFTDNKVGRGIPLSVIRVMNAVEAANPENFIPFLELPDLIESLDKEQVDILAMDFPVLNVAGKMTPFFTWLRRHPEEWKRLKEGQGVLINSPLLHALTETARLLPLPLTGDLLPQGVGLTNLTLYFTDTETPLPPGTEPPETLPKDYLRARTATLSIRNKQNAVVKALEGFYLTINPKYRFAR